jgi:hypothetical protein
MHYARKARRWGRRFYDRHFRNFTFIHINKNGGSSIEKALGLRPEHKTALEKREELGAAAWERRFTFTIVRNPWDRVVSQYHYRMRVGKNDLASRKVAFGDWVRLVFRELDPRYRNEPLMFVPQWDWTVDGGGKPLLDFVGRFENLEGDFAHICSRIGRNVELPHVNPTRRGPYREYYDPETEELVRNAFAVDLERFDYSF